MIKSKGFTIIELIVVIAIIAVLAGIVLVNVQGYIKKSKNTRSLAELKKISTIATDYYYINGNYDNFSSNVQVRSILDNFAKDNSDATVSFSSYNNFYACSDGTCSPSGGTFGACSGKYILYFYGATGFSAAGNMCFDSTGFAREYTSLSNCACN